ncbi:MAG: PEP-CTERM sorting domain-containing protein [Planctomycetota bacterium]|nr:PEP-CTERM sorting domain-containing protein [Planctomycetota bacterium]
MSASARGAWVTTQVDTDGNVGFLTSLAQDPVSNYPHISYYDQTNSSLKYASWGGSGWNTQTVDNWGYVGPYSSLAFYNNDAPRISYTSYTYNGATKVPNGIKYAYWIGGYWHIEFVQAGTNVGEYTSLAVDATGRSHVSYYDRSSGTLRYAIQNGTVWNIQTVDTGDTGLYSSLKLDTNGNPRIAYHDETNGTLRYAAYDGSVWHYTTVDASTHVGAHPSLALTSTGDPIISYFDSTNTDLKLAMYDGDWHVGAVDTAGIVGFGNSLALDPETDLPRIAYASGNPEAGDTDLKLAYWDGLAWQFEDVDTPGIVGEYPSLALDPDTGVPMVSYYDRTNGNLKFAMPAGAIMPEPTTLGLLAIGAIAAYARRSRARRR